MSAVIHGSHAQLEIPRDKLNMNDSARISMSCVVPLRKPPVIGTAAITKIKNTRRPQPP
jgi:hypothetical protein